MINVLRNLSLVLLILLLSFSTLQTQSASGAYEETALTQVSGLGITHGAHIRPTNDYGKQIKNFNSVSGKDIGILMYFMDWKGNSTSSTLDTFLLDRIRNYQSLTTKPAIMLTWQPWNGKKSEGCNRDYAPGEFIGFDTIINGGCDTYLREFARDLSNRPERFLLRFAHEMNIADYKWSLNPSKYIQMWRHVYDVVEGEQKRMGKSNIEWVWSPNYGSNPYTEANSLHNYYPGDTYVDWIGLSGYNWAGSRGEPWRSFSQLYGNSDGSGAVLPPGVLQDLACHYAKPQIIAEVGTVEGQPGKANWVKDMYGKLPDYPFLRAVVWFNDYAFEDVNSADFRVVPYVSEEYPNNPGINFTNPRMLNLDAGITNQYKASVAAPVYRSTLPSLKDATPPQTYCQTGNPQISVNRQSILVTRNSSTTLTITGSNLPSAQKITVSSPGDLQVELGDATLSSPSESQTVTIRANSNAPIKAYQVNFTVSGKTIPVTVHVVNRIYRLLLPSIRKN